MNNEIKEILDWLKDEDIYVEDYGFQYKRISLREIKQLLDYITNLQQDTEMYAQLKDEYEEEIKELQQENERLKENNSNMQEEMARVWEENERKDRLIEEYKEGILAYADRNEKAIEYIKSIDEDILSSMFLDESYISNYGAIELLNILQNGSDSQ